MDAFFIWATEQGLDIAAMFEDHQKHIDDLNLVLEKFGRALYEHGKSYGKYAEMLNAITSWKPALDICYKGHGTLVLRGTGMSLACITLQCLALYPLQS